MTWQAFGSLAAGNEPLSLFDTLSGQIALCVNVPCTATGTNDYSLTVTGLGPTITSYNNFNLFSWVAPNNSTGASHLQVASIGFKKLFTSSGNQAGNGDITQNTLYLVAFNSALDTGAGGFIIVSATPSSLTLPVSVANGGTGDASLTAFAVLCGGTTSTNPVQPIASVGTANQVLTSNGAGALPTFQTPSAGAGSLVSIVTYTSTQTVTIPASATKAFIRLVGGGGGSATGAVGSAAGAGAYLEKYLSGLTSGNTLSLTIGAAGAAGNHAGGNSTLASGTQVITTLTAAGGAGSANATAGTGGTATNGDINVSGGTGKSITIPIPCPTFVPIEGGSNPLSSSAQINAAGPLYGAGGCSGPTGADSGGGIGVCVIEWFT